MNDTNPAIFTASANQDNRAGSLSSGRRRDFVVGQIPLLGWSGYSPTETVVPASIGLARVSRAGNFAAVSTNSAHSLVRNDRVSISGVSDATFNAVQVPALPVRGHVSSTAGSPTLTRVDGSYFHPEMAGRKMEGLGTIPSVDSDSQVTLTSNYGSTSPSLLWVVQPSPSFFGCSNTGSTAAPANLGGQMQRSNRYSRALQAETQHWFRITCGAALPDVTTTAGPGSWRCKRAWTGARRAVQAHGRWAPPRLRPRLTKRPPTAEGGVGRAEHLS